MRVASVALLSASGAVALVPTAASAATDAIVTDSGCTTNSMGLNDDDYTGLIPLSSTLRFYDGDVSAVRVSNNGVFFMAESWDSIAPFWTDLDSRYTGTPVTYGETTFEGRPALCANWLNIGFYAQGNAPTVDVQGLLVDRSDLQAGDFDIVFNYGRIGGTPYGPTIGFSSSDEGGSNNYYMPGSGIPGAFDDSNAETGLVHGSRGSEVLGRYVFRFRAGVPVGIAAPVTTIATQAAALSNDATPTFTYASSAAGEEHERFECRVAADGVLPGAFETCPDDGLTYDTMADGSYTFEVRAVDSYANTDSTPASATFTIDTTGPDTTVLTAPAALSNDTTASFTYEGIPADDADGFECRVTTTGDAADDFAACNDEGGFTTGELADGSYTFEVRSLDALGNADATPASHDFVVDTTPSVATIDTAPAALGNESTVDFTYSADPSVDVDRFECRLVGSDPVELATCDDAGETYAELADGDYTFEVRAVDTADNTGAAAAYDFTVETVPGDTEVTSGPKALGNDTTPSFTYASDAEDLDFFECRLVGSGTSAFADCDDDGTSFGPLGDGDYTFEVRAVDLAGNADTTPATHEFTVDTVAPESSITEAPAAMVGTNAATFGFASDADPSTFECRLSAAGQPGAWQACPDGSKTFSGLADGGYDFEVRATDAAGNTDATPATGKVEVNVGRPTITASLSSEIPISAFGWYRTTVTITYACAGNGSALTTPCPAPREVPRAQRGRNTFKASIKTADGDTASVSTTLYIDKGRPSLEIKGFSGTEVYTSMPKPRCVASDPRSGLDDCTIRVKKVTRKNGDRFIVVRAKATDKAGNVRIVKKQAPFRAA